MELEIKHLAPYLPYNLKVSKLHTLSAGGGIGSIEHLLTTKSTNYKPILRPISKFGDSDDLRKVHEFIGLGKWCEAYDDYFNAWFDDAGNVDKLVLQAPYEVFQFFLANHYDVFGLIPKGLAVEEKLI